MTKKKLRSISFDSHKYLWKIETKYICIDKLKKDYRAEISFTAYLNGYKNTPLNIIFNTIACPIIGNPLTNDLERTNLNKPSMAKQLISFGIQKGWEGQHKKLIISNANLAFEEMGFDVSYI